MKLSTGALAAASARHPWRTIGAWIGAVVAAFVLVGVLLGDALTTDYLPTNNPESIQARDAIAEAFPPESGTRTTDVVIVRSERYTVDDPEFASFVTGLVADGGDALAGSPTFVTSDAAPVSEDRRATLIAFDAKNGGIEDALAAVGRADADEAFAVAITGLETIDHDYNKLAQDDLKTGELQFGLPAALIILLLVFGAVVAGLIPLLMAIVSIVVALGIVAVVAQATELSVFIVNMLVAMGLALGIDYALFVISRYREERGHGRAEHEAIEVAGATASRAVVFSGTAFVVAMFGMFIVPNSVMRSLAVGAILVGVVSVAAAVTLLPALLGLLGDKVDALRIPLFGRKSFEQTNPEGRFWGAIVGRVLRRPGLSFGVSVGALLLLAAPVLGMTIGSRGVSTLPDRFESKQGFEILAQTFPEATTDPVEIVVSWATGTQATGLLESLQSELARDARFGPGQVRTSVDGELAVLAVPIEGDPRGDDAMAAIHDLRTELIPASFGETGAVVLVGGTTAETLDYVDSVTDPVPFVIALVLGLTFILLIVVFRSVVIAGTAVFLNLLSVGAAYGLLVVVFQWGWGVGLLGFEQADSIEAWVPLFLFAVLFGLSMDYQVFLLSRIRERYDETGDTSDAVYFGVSSTARIITGAALIIVAVFAGFARGELIEFQQMGFGVGVALLLDATVIRGVVLPSTMRLLGEWNWYLPRWLHWIPRVHAEGAPPARPAPVLEGAES